MADIPNLFHAVFEDQFTCLTILNNKLEKVEGPFVLIRALVRLISFSIDLSICKRLWYESTLFLWEQRSATLTHFMWSRMRSQF